MKVSETELNKVLQIIVLLVILVYRLISVVALLVQSWW